MPYIVDVLHPVDRVAVSQIGLQAVVHVAGIGRLVGIGCRRNIHCQVYGREGTMYVWRWRRRMYHYQYCTEWCTKIIAAIIRNLKK